MKNILLISVVTLIGCSGAAFTAEEKSATTNMHQAGETSSGEAGDKNTAGMTVGGSNSGGTNDNGGNNPTGGTNPNSGGMNQDGLSGTTNGGSNIGGAIIADNAGSGGEGGSVPQETCNPSSKGFACTMAVFTWEGNSTPAPNAWECSEVTNAPPIYLEQNSLGNNIRHCTIPSFPSFGSLPNNLWCCTDH